MVCTDASLRIPLTVSERGLFVSDRDRKARVEEGLKLTLGDRALHGSPPRLAAAIRHAVFAGGGRVRPKLCLAVAEALGDGASGLADGAAVAIELLHCASLVHDDLPCFDDAPTRRGRPSVHAAYGEATAVLVGDALIVLAFDVLARAGAAAPSRLPGLLGAVARAAGTPHGIIAGQALEQEPVADLDGYHAAKTAALFEAATACGALAAGHDPEPWRQVGTRLGLAYQIADDVADATGDAKTLGKPVQRDAALGRPNIVGARGLDASRSQGRRLVEEALALVPPCPGREPLRAWIDAWSRRFGL